ncbi:hypothetical protein Rhal01_03421 [Rubritalea halochordaticola]|uniref:CcmD family protein n=1 Tax=Rubritalea halochordaticola TaxID=714537 RepID=A0ABP9V3J6_9BACT
MTKIYFTVAFLWLLLCYAVQPIIPESHNMKQPLIAMLEGDISTLESGYLSEEDREAVVEEARQKVKLLASMESHDRWILPRNNLFVTTLLVLGLLSVLGVKKVAPEGRGAPAGSDQEKG